MDPGPGTISSSQDMDMAGRLRWRRSFRHGSGCQEARKDARGSTDGGGSVLILAPLRSDLRALWLPANGVHTIHRQSAFGLGPDPGVPASVGFRLAEKPHVSLESLLSPT